MKKNNQSMFVQHLGGFVSAFSGNYFANGVKAKQSVFKHVGVGGEWVNERVGEGSLTRHRSAVKGNLGPLRRAARDLPAPIRRMVESSLFSVLYVCKDICNI